MSKYKQDTSYSGTNFEPEINSCLCSLFILGIDFIYFFINRYPTRSQYTTVVIGILKHLGIEHNEKNAVSKYKKLFLLKCNYYILQNSWRESLISKYKRERQNLDDDKITEMKHKYSKLNSGRKIKGFPMTQMSERNSLKEVSHMERLRKCIFYF